MRGLQKSKRVSWPSDVNLCQVRLFLSEDSPFQVGLNSQDHLQAKTSCLPHSNGTGSDDNLPPGFEGAHPVNPLKNKLAQIPLIKWRCPPKFLLNDAWRVVSGEESEEREAQKQREMRVLEAVYPRPSAIPPNPSYPAEGEDIDNNHHQQILLIPIVPVEDEEAALEASADMVVAPTTNIPMSSQSQLLLPPGIPSASSSSNAPIIPNPPVSENVAARMAPGVEPDVVAAASAALTAVMRSNEQGSLIDHNLLVQLLSNPVIIERIVTESSSNPQPVPNQRLPPIALSDQPPGHVSVSRAETQIPLSAAIPSVPFYSQSQSNGPGGPVPGPRPPPPPPMVGPSSSSSSSPPVTKDINYFKSLIQQHGGERAEPQDQPHSHPQFTGRPNHHVLGLNPETVVTHPKPRDSKPKIMKPCIYFHSSRGCRHGANCSYQHDACLQQRVSSMPEVQNAKRMKMDREITGT